MTLTTSAIRHPKILNFFTAIDKRTPSDTRGCMGRRVGLHATRPTVLEPGTAQYPCSFVAPPWFSDLSCVFSTSRVVLGDGEVDGPQKVLELGARERHGLRRAVIKRAIRCDQENAWLAE